jgi:hypothetical protein
VKLEIMTGSVAQKEHRRDHCRSSKRNEEKRRAP